MARLIERLIVNNLSQIAYVRAFHGEHYADIGHAERFIGAGVGFEEIQLRNLMYFAYLDTVEEATADLDVTTTDMLFELVGDLRSRSIEVLVAQVRGTVRDRLRKTGLMTELGEERVYLSIGSAVNDFGRRWPPAERSGTGARSRTGWPPTCPSRSGPNGSPPGTTSCWWCWR